MKITKILMVYWKKYCPGFIIEYFKKIKMNINISDEFFAAVEEYHTTIKKEHLKKILENVSYEYLRGMFYTALRRHFNICKAKTRNYSGDIKVKDISCIFDESHRIISFTINKIAPFNMGWYENGEDKALTLYELKKITNIHKTIYPTITLNQLAQIVNSI